MQWEKDLEAKHAAEIFIWRGRSGNPGLRLIHRLESAENVHGLNRVGSSRVPYVTNRETQTHPIYTHLTYTTGDLHIRPHPQRWTENQGILSENLAAIASQKWGVRDWWTNLLVFNKLCWFFVSTVIYFLLHVLSIHVFGIYFKVLLFPYLFPPSEFLHEFHEATSVSYWFWSTHPFHHIQCIAQNIAEIPKTHLVNSHVLKLTLY